MATSRRITTEVYNHRVKQLQNQREAQQQYNTKLKVDSMLEEVIRSQDRVDDKRESREMARQHQERMLDHQICRSREIREAREKQAEQEENLAHEMERIKLEKMREEKKRQQIRNNSEEIRELESKLRTGYMNRERAAQVAERRALRLEELQREAEIRKIIENETKRAKIAEEQKDVEKYQQSQQYKQDLEHQLEDEQKRKQEAYEEFLKEKLMIDEIVRKIYEEDERNESMRIERMSATKRYIDEFKRTRDEWRRSEKERFEEENKRIMRHAEEQRKREEERAQQQHRDYQAKEAITEALGDKLYADQLKREEREDVHLELLMEEQREAEQKKELAEKEKTFRTRIQMQQDYRQEMEHKIMKQRADRVEEAEFARLMMEKFAADDRLHLMSDQKRRMKQLEYKRAIQKMLAERRAKFDQELVEHRGEFGRWLQAEAARNKIIEEERQRLLKEHATKLLGYLPKNVLETSQDLQLFDGNFQNEYQKRARDPFDDSLEFQ